jgi:hypothetical protein
VAGIDAIQTLATVRDEPAGRAKLFGPNYVRDRFIYEGRKKGETWKAIMIAVNGTKGWRKLGSETAVQNAYKRYEWKLKSAGDAFNGGR